MKRLFFSIITSIFCVASGSAEASAQNRSGDVFVPIAKYIQKGDADKLSAWFGSNLEIEIFGQQTRCSKVQAKQIMRVFFRQYHPKTFDIIHRSGNPSMKYAIGRLSTGADNFRVILLVRTQPDSSHLLRIKIEKDS